MADAILTSSGIYAIRNIINDKKYIGSAKNFNLRFQAHLRELRRNKHHSIKLQRAWNKYGENSFVFEVIQEVASLSDLLAVEQLHIDAHKSATNKGYNACPNAGSKLGTKLRQESKDKIGNANRGYKHTEENKKRMSLLATGRKLSDAAREKVRKAVTGRKHTPESIEKMRVVQSGKKLSEAQKAILLACRLGSKLTNEHKEKLRVSSTGRKHTEEAKQKIRQIVTAYWQNKRMLANQ
jgi:group I intron endonuclease